MNQDIDFIKGAAERYQWAVSQIRNFINNNFTSFTPEERDALMALPLGTTGHLLHLPSAFVQGEIGRHGDVVLRQVNEIWRQQNPERRRELTQVVRSLPMARKPRKSKTRRRDGEKRMPRVRRPKKEPRRRGIGARR